MGNPAGLPTFPYRGALPRRTFLAGGSPSVAGTSEPPGVPAGRFTCEPAVPCASIWRQGHGVEMTTIFEAALDLPVTILGREAVLVSEGASSGKLYILKSGELEVVRNGSVVATFGEPGDVVGEMSALLDQPHSATVRSRDGAEVYVVDDASSFLERHPAVAREIARSLAQRLSRTTALLVDMRQRSKEREDQEIFDKIFALLK